MEKKNIKWSQQQKGVFFVLVFDILLAISGSLTKTLSPDLPFNLIIIIRLTFAMFSLSILSLFGLNLFKKINEVKPRNLPKIMLLGVLSSGVGFLFYTIGIRQAGVGIGSLLSGQETIFGIIFGVVILKEKISFSQILILCGLIFGLFLLLSKNLLNTQLNDSVLIGAIFSILSAVSLGLGNVIAKIFLNQKIHPEVIVFFRCLGGTIFNLFISSMLDIDLITSLININFWDWLKLIYIGMIFSSIGLLIQFKGIRNLKINQFSVIYALYPIFSVILGIMFLNEKFSLLQVVGIFVIILSSIMFIHRSKIGSHEKG